MKALIEAELSKQTLHERQRVTRRRGEQRAASEALIIRTASERDHGRLRRLAVLDSAPLPAGPTLVAERDGMLVAAVPLGEGRPIADPFVPSADVVGLLELRRMQLRAAA